MKYCLNIFIESYNSFFKNMDSGLRRDDGIKASAWFIVPVLSVFAFLLPALAFAAVTLSISGSLPGMAPVSAGSNPGVWIQGFYGLALMLGGVLAFGAVVYGGVLYAASAGNASRQTEGKEWIWSALTGLLLLAGAWLVLHTINPDLTNVAFPTLSSLSAVGTSNNNNNNNVGAYTPTYIMGVSGYLGGLQASTTAALGDLEQACTQKNNGMPCSINVTAGTNGAHAVGGACTHASGCKADIAPNYNVTAYIQSLPSVSPSGVSPWIRGDGAQLFQAPDGAVYANELTPPPKCSTPCEWSGPHWDMAASPPAAKK
jgi:hypothetical protein